MPDEKLREKSPGDLALELDAIKEQLERMNAEIDTAIAKNKEFIRGLGKS